MSQAAVGDLRGSRPKETAEQLALLPESGDEADEAVAAAAEARGRGRPAGAVNRATRQMRDYILSNFTDPASGLAASGLRSTLPASIEAARALARDLGTKPFEALEFMRKCSEALMPYTHSKMPLAVNVRGKIAALHIGLGSDGQARAGGEALAELLDGFAAGATEAAVALALEDLSEEEDAAKSEA